MKHGVVDLLQESRRREKAQTTFYRGVASQASEEGDDGTQERIHGLLADEQHHLARLSARVLELGGDPEALEVPSVAPVSLIGWEGEARRRETEEVAWYSKLRAEALDPVTRALLEEILDSERRHLEDLGGKWMSAWRDTPGKAEEG